MCEDDANVDWDYDPDSNSDFLSGAEPATTSLEEQRIAELTFAIRKLAGVEPTIEESQGEPPPMYVASVQVSYAQGGASRLEAMERLMDYLKKLPFPESMSLGSLSDVVVRQNTTIAQAIQSLDYLEAEVGITDEIYGSIQEIKDLLEGKEEDTRRNTLKRLVAEHPAYGLPLELVYWHPNDMETLCTLMRQVGLFPTVLEWMLDAGFPKHIAYRARLIVPDLDVAPSNDGEVARKAFEEWH